jgi:hypothetical protein
VEIVVAASVAQRALSCVGQRGDEVCPLRMPAGSRTGQGRPPIGSPRRWGGDAHGVEHVGGKRKRGRRGS